MFYTFTSKQFGGRIPDPLYVEATLSRNLARSWQITDIDGFLGAVDSKERAEERPVPRPCNEDSADRETCWSATWHFLEPTKRYTLVVTLHYKNNGISPEELKLRITENQDDTVKVVAYYKDSPQ